MKSPLRKSLSSFIIHHSSFIIHHSSLVQHDLSSCHRNRLARLVGLLDAVQNCSRHVNRKTAAPHRHLVLVKFPDLGHASRARHLAGSEILHKQALFRMAPERPVIIVARTDAVDLDSILDQFLGKTLRQPDCAEFGPSVGAVLVAAFQAALGVDLHDVRPGASPSTICRAMTRAACLTHRK